MTGLHLLLALATWVVLALIVCAGYTVYNILVHLL